MNKRQKKKRINEICNRSKFVGIHFIFAGRSNGKYLLEESLLKIIHSKKYKPFRQLKKEYRRLYLSVDFSNGKDRTAKCYYRFIEGICRIVKIDYE